MAWTDIAGAAGESLGGLSSAVSASRIYAQEQAKKDALAAQEAENDLAERALKEAHARKYEWEMNEPQRKSELWGRLGTEMKLSPQRMRIMRAAGPEALSSYEAKLGNIYAHYADQASKGQFVSPMQYRSQMVAAGEDDQAKLDRDVQTFQETNTTVKKTKVEEETAKRKADLESDIEKQKVLGPMRTAEAMALQKSADAIADANRLLKEEQDAKKAGQKYSSELDMALRNGNYARDLALRAAEKARAILTGNTEGKGPEPTQPGFLQRVAGQLEQKWNWAMVKSGIGAQDERMRSMFQALSALRGQAATLAPKGSRTALNIEEIKQHFAKPEFTLYEAYKMSQEVAELLRLHEIALKRDYRDAAIATQMPIPEIAKLPEDDLPHIGFGGPQLAPLGEGPTGPPGAPFGAPPSGTPTVDVAPQFPTSERARLGKLHGKQLIEYQGWMYNKDGIAVRRK